MPTSEAITRGVRVSVDSRYVPEQSNPAGGRWFFAYRIRIANEGADTVQLLSRHWIITDGDGEVQEVRGPGVIGKQPILRPGDAFEYESFCPLGTSFGTMHGTYEMTVESGTKRETFQAEIAPFSLAQPYAIN